MFVVQETKCSTKEIPGATKVPGYKTYWLDGDKDGYAGVGLYTKTEPISISYGLGMCLLSLSNNNTFDMFRKGGV